MNLKATLKIKGREVKHGISTIRGADVETVQDYVGISEVFASFHDDLYSSRRRDGRFGKRLAATCNDELEVQAFHLDELQEALKAMKNGKAKDQAGTIAQMMKAGTDQLLNLILEVFNDILLL